jgi:hypothetical protein
MSEHDEQTQLFQILALYEERYPVLRWIFAIPNGGKRHPATAMKLKQEGVRRGIPDICIPYPVDEWAGCYVEMKFGKGRLTKEQQEFIEAFQNTHKIYVCYSAIEAAHAIGEYLGIDELKEVE